MTRKTGFISDDLAATVVPTAPTDLVVGGPCSVGRVPAVVAEAVDEDGAAVVRFRGVFRMPVAETDVAPGDKIWFNATDSSLSKTSTGAIQFGYAMESITDGDGVTDILVLLRGGNITVPVTVPGVPFDPDYSTRSATSITFTWSAPLGDFGDLVYDVRWKLGTDATYTEPADLMDITQQSAAITGLTASTTYDFQVRAQNSAGASAWSATHSIDTTA